MVEDEISGQIRNWLSSMQDLNSSAFQSDDLDELMDEEVWISDQFNNHLQSEIESCKVNGTSLRNEDLRHNFQTKGFSSYSQTRTDWDRTFLCVIAGFSTTGLICVVK
jgi:hypothetical protein